MILTAAPIRIGGGRRRELPGRRRPGPAERRVCTEVRQTVWHTHVTAELGELPGLGEIWHRRRPAWSWSGEEGGASSVFPAGGSGVSTGRDDHEGRGGVLLISGGLVGRAAPTKGVYPPLPCRSGHFTRALYRGRGPPLPRRVGRAPCPGSADRCARGGGWQRCTRPVDGAGQGWPRWVS